MQNEPQKGKFVVVVVVAGVQCVLAYPLGYHGRLRSTRRGNGKGNEDPSGHGGNKSWLNLRQCAYVAGETIRIDVKVNWTRVQKIRVGFGLI